MQHTVNMFKINTINMNLNIRNAYFKMEKCMNQSSTALISTPFAIYKHKLALQIFHLLKSWILILAQNNH